MYDSQQRWGRELVKGVKLGGCLCGTFSALMTDPRKRDDGRGSGVFLGGLGRDHLVQGQIGNAPPEPGILRLKLL